MHDKSDIIRDPLRDKTSADVFSIKKAPIKLMNALIFCYVLVTALKSYDFKAFPNDTNSTFTLFARTAK